MSERLSRKVAGGSDPQHPFRHELRRVRAWVGARPRLRWLYRLAVALTGSLIVLVGAILIPLPGPGWLIVFVGMAILGSEFPAAARFTAFVKRLFRGVWAWVQDRRAARPAVAVENA